ncbi:MAG: D-alanyl-D-alanine carboxypeptidase/D-alanyl-D-alanine-endopeptidase [Gemmatimonadota bacterium]
MTRLPAILVLALLALPAALSAQDGAIGPELDSWLTRAQRSAPGKWAVVVADQGGNILWSVNGSEPMVPASTVKLLTTGFARTVVGSDARRATRVVGTGRVNPLSGTWEGRWALELNGDVTLERRDRTGPSLSTLAEQLSALGVRRLVGPLTVTTSVGEPRSTYPAAWSDRHRGRIFAPPVGPITLNENLVEFTVAPGSRAGARAVIVGDAPAGAGSLVSVTATTVAGSRSSLRISAQKNGRWVVSGRIGSRAGARRFTSVASDPTAVLEAAWAHAVAIAGIEWVHSPSIGSADPGERRVLAEIVSQPFDSIAHEINTRSLNIGAELMLLWGGGVDHAADRLTQHVRAVTGLAEGVTLHDGSGLSSDDRVSPFVFTSYLAKFPLTPAGKNFPLLLPANGSGTLRRLAAGLPGPGVVRAKTGTLGNSSTLVGYLGRNTGTLLIAAMYNGGSVGAAKQAEWTLFRLLGANGIVVPLDMDPAGALGSTPDEPPQH